MNGRIPAAAAALLVALGCEPQRSSWGLDAIRTMKTPADDPTLGCGVAIPPDGTGAQRGTCSFGPGTFASQSLAIDPGTLARIPIRHVVILMKENRSFDHLLGALADAGQAGAEGVQASFANPDLNGVPVTPFPAATTCYSNDPGHQQVSVLACIDQGRMDGFVKSAAQTTGTDGHFVMSYNTPADVPFYYWLASTFAVGDRDFAAMASGTFGNRDFMLFGTNAGVVDTGIVYPSPSTPNIFQLLMNAGYTWGVYSDGPPLSEVLGWANSDPGVHPFQDFLKALDQGTLPNVAFVDGQLSINDDHPTADLQVGEAWVHTIYQHAIPSPQWPWMAILWTYDEAGGFADHVPPPTACAAEPGSPFTQRGPRVPVVAISPWARRGYVSHVVRDHTSITRFVETVFQLPALTYRDANADALLDLFDFSCGRNLSVPAAPVPGTGGCP